MARNHGSFSGNPETTWLTEGAPDRKMRLTNAFHYIDPKGKKWPAPANYVVDGASIPRALWTMVGSPYTGDYRRASIVHDVACDEAQGDPKARRRADRMFFHACMAGGCPWWEAAMLYIGVRIGAIIESGSSVAWRETGPKRTAFRARTSPNAAELRIQADFRLLADRVLALGETEDAVVLERRVNKSLSELSLPH